MIPHNAKHIFIAIACCFFAGSAFAASDNSQASTERNLNRATVSKFFALPIGDERAALFAEDGQKELRGDSGMRWTGMAAIKENTAGNEKMFLNWKWNNVKVWDTQDPDMFWVQADGSGQTHTPAPGSDLIPIGGHYVVQLQLSHGKIEHLWELRYKEYVPFAQN